MNTVTLTLAEIAALYFDTHCDPDQDPDTEYTIGMYERTTDNPDEGITETGMYYHYQEYPEEGVIGPLHAFDSYQETSNILIRGVYESQVAKRKFPQPNYVALKVAEEAGELVKSAVHYAENRDSWDNVEREAVQAIAMILRLLTEGDHVNGIIPPKTETSIKKHQRAIEPPEDEENNLLMAEQQFTGYISAKNDRGIEDMISAMGLTKAEWSKLKQRDSLKNLPEEAFSSINEIFS